MFYVSGTQLMTPERRKAVWAIYGMISIHINPALFTCPIPSSC